MPMPDMDEHADRRRERRQKIARPEFHLFPHSRQLSATRHSQSFFVEVDHDVSVY